MTSDGAPDRAVADRVVDEDRDELAQAGGVAGDLDGRRIERDPDLRLGGQPGQRAARVGGDVGQVDRLAGELDGPRVAPGEQEQVLDERGQVVGLGGDVVDRRADLADRLVGVAPEVLGARPDDGQRRPQLVARVGGELALVAERVADRDERPAGDDRSRRRARPGSRRGRRRRAR